MRGVLGQLVPCCSSKECASKVLVETNYVTYTTKYEEMNRALRVWGILVRNFTYEFSVPERLHRLNDTSDGNFLLTLHTLEVGFHLSFIHSSVTSLKSTISLLERFERRLAFLQRCRNRASTVRCWPRNHL
ncbi:hypothetical protein PVK06_041305 [Gossypium arboreum]|uniref:Uncharacterized protein n=1 Tax=Gossypium arboreum TaxID=29729 RepID=A0ABR0N7U1_GOSAR|nr:hypothetical protein PVK06_041305 [Gossypium arboreum]